jgi:DNA-binding NarL/FixJ family response regulator
MVAPGSPCDDPGMQGERIRVVLADDEAPVRALLGITLSMDRDFQIVGEAADGEQAVHLIEEQHPDAVILDLMMPVLGGMAAIPQIKACCPECKIIIFSALSADQAASEALACGADAYVEKTRFVTELSETLHRVCMTAA